MLSEQSAAELGESREALFGAAEIRERAPIDALWFARFSPPKRDAWELRLVSASPFALFETFEQDETEEEREELRREMEAQLIERMATGIPSAQLEADADDDEN